MKKQIVIYSVLGLLAFSMNSYGVHASNSGPSGEYNEEDSAGGGADTPLYLPQKKNPVLKGAVPATVSNGRGIASVAKAKSQLPEPPKTSGGAGGGDDRKPITRTNIDALDSGVRATITKDPKTGGFIFKVSGKGEGVPVKELSAAETSKEVGMAKHMRPEDGTTLVEALGGAEGASSIRAFSLNRGLVSFLGVKNMEYYWPTRKSTQDGQLAGQDVNIGNVLVKPLADGSFAVIGGGGGGGGGAGGKDDTPPAGPKGKKKGA